jgi:hypothetical protein
MLRPYASDAGKMILQDHYQLGVEKAAKDHINRIKAKRMECI